MPATAALTGSPNERRAAPAKGSSQQDENSKHSDEFVAQNPKVSKLSSFYTFPHWGWARASRFFHRTTPSLQKLPRSVTIVTCDDAY